MALTKTLLLLYIPLYLLTTMAAEGHLRHVDLPGFEPGSPRYVIRKYVFSLLLLRQTMYLVPNS